MIVDLLDYLYSSTANKVPFFKKIRLYSALRFIIRIVANNFIPVYFKLTKGNKKYSLKTYSENSNGVIVSLTSFPKRINRLWIVIETILRQTLPPKKIILWLSADQFSDMEQLPASLLAQQERGLEIRIMPNDLRSHKKYYYALTEYPDHDIVLIDDDIFYRSTMIEDMRKYADLNPQCVIAQFGKTMLWNDLDKLKPYVSWPLVITETKPRDDIFFGTGGGVLINKRHLSDDALNKDLFIKLAPTADDVWINAMCRLQGTKVVKTKYYSYHLPVLSPNDSTLFDVNESLNDITITAVNAHYVSNNAGVFDKK